jgi:CRISPR-associated protein Cas5d
MSMTEGKAQIFCLKAWGALACFTRPELKAERFSYPVMTPSAARGVLDAIYCKPPEFQWRIHRIEVLTPPLYIALRRNEVKEKVAVPAVQRWMSGVEEPEPIWADGDKRQSGSDEKGRTQRQTMALKDVSYRIHASIRRWPNCRHNQTALEEQFVRRVRSGKCFQQPYLGCREFPAYFELAESSAEAPYRYTADVGLMLYDVIELSRPGNSVAAPSVSLFRARVENGILDIPAFEDDAVLKSVRAEGGV